MNATKRWPTALSDHQRDQMLPVFEALFQDEKFVTAFSECVRILAADLPGGPGELRAALGRLGDCVRVRAPDVTLWFGRYLPRELGRFVLYSSLCHRGVTPEEADATATRCFGPMKSERLFPHLPVTLEGEDAVVGLGRIPDTQARRKAARLMSDYFTSLRPPGRPGRPPKEETLAPVVYAKMREGKHWKDIVCEEGLRDKRGRQYDLYDQKDAKRAYSHVRRLKERGQILGAS